MVYLIKKPLLDLFLHTFHWKSQKEIFAPHLTGQQQLLMFTWLITWLITIMVTQYLRMRYVQSLYLIGQFVMTIFGIIGMRGHAIIEILIVSALRWWSGVSEHSRLQWSLCQEQIMERHAILSTISLVFMTLLSRDQIRAFLLAWWNVITWRSHDQICTCICDDMITWSDTGFLNARLPC